MKYVLSKFKIKHDKAEKTKIFLRDLHQNRQKEMEEVLKESLMVLDCSFLESSNEGNFLYIFKKLQDINILNDKIKGSSLPIYERIRKWADECIEEGEDIKPIAIFDKG